MNLEEVKFWLDHLARLNILKLNQITNSMDVSQTERRIENAEMELDILMSETYK